MLRHVYGCVAVLLCLVSALAHADAGASSAQAAEPRGHGPRASMRTFPSHVFQLKPHWHPQPELSVHFGLLQPALFRGFNAALDLRVGPMLLSYSHGQGLNYSATPSMGLSPEEQRAGLSLISPWTTGGGVGVILLDELYLMVDLKVHRYQAELDEQRSDYTTISVGLELGYRLFLWRGLFVQTVVRYWPNVYSSLPGDAVQLGDLRHEAKNLGVFANVMLGFAFDI
jgi:hypothetical protein